MYVILFALGLGSTAAGIAMVVFGVFNNEFSLGNTLLITGTTAIMSGLILVALAAAVRQLRRIAEASVTRPAQRTARSPEASDSLAAGNAQPALGRAPFPAKSFPQPPGPDPLEHRLAIAPSIDAANEAALEPPPRVPFPPAPPGRRGSEERREPSWFAKRETRPDFTAVMDEGSDMASSGGPMASEGLAAVRLDIASRPIPSSETARPSQLFDSLWPVESRSGAAPTPAPETEPKRDASQAAAAKKKESDAEKQKPDERSAEPHIVSILKSGIIDEMAYTLYSDGSIEAELPQGTMRFASIAELRGYLEKSS